MKCIRCGIEMTEGRMLLACAMTRSSLELFGPDSGGTSSEITIPIEPSTELDEVFWCSADCFAHWVAEKAAVLG